MTSQRILGIVLLAIGIGLLIFGLNATDSVGERVTEGITGKYTDKTTWYILGGVALALAGGAMALIGGRRARSA